MGKKSDSHRHRVALVASPGVPVFEFAIAAEVFGVDRRDITPDWYEFILATVDNEGATIAHDIRVPGGRGLTELRAADTVIVPACAQIHAHAPDRLLQELRAAHTRGARIAAICSGSFVLAEAGLLDGRRATTHWMHADALAARYPTIHVDPGVLYVHDDVWTSAGSAAGLDMCLQLVRQDHGAAVANEVARRIVTPPHRDGGQSQYVRPGSSRGHSDSDIQDWTRRNLADVTVAAMAHRAGVSTRTLNRQFRDRTGQSPQAWLQRLRLDTAAELLEATDLSVESIARHVGLGGATNLRVHFTAAYGLSPSRYRRTFRSLTQDSATEGRSTGAAAPDAGRTVA